MRKYQLYKHKLMRDVALKPTSIFFVPEKQIYKVSGIWYNIHYADLKCGLPFPLTERKDKLELTPEQYKQFIPYDLDASYE